MYPAAILCALGLLTAQYMVGRGTLPFLALPAFFILCAAGAAGFAAVFRRDPAVPRAWCVVFALALAAWVAVPVAGRQMLWLEGGVFRVVLASAVVYGLLVFCITGAGPRMVFVSILLAGAAVQGGLGIFQYMNPAAPIDFGWISTWNPGRLEGHAFRARGFYYNANHLAWLLNFGGAFALAIGVWGRPRVWARVLWLYLAAMFFATGILTQSRGGLLGSFAALAAFALLSGRVMFQGARVGGGRMAGIAGVALVLCSGAAWFAFSSSDLAQFRFLTAPEEGYRAAVWQTTLRQWQLEPLAGTGAGTFMNFTRLLRFRGDNLDDGYAHNDWVQGLAEFGMAGAGLGICALVLHLAAGWRSFGSAIRSRACGGAAGYSAAFQIGAFSAMAAFAVHSFFDFNMQIPANLLLLAACMGLLASPGRREAETARARVWLRSGAAVTAACGLYLGWVSVKALDSEFEWVLADREFRGGRLEEALNHSRRGASRNPAHARLHEMVGRCALSLAKKAEPGSREQRLSLEEADAAFLSASRLEPADAWHRVFLGHTRDNLRADAEGDRVFLEAIERAPNYPTHYEFFALHLELTGRPEEAKRLYGLALAFPGTTFSRERLEALEHNR